MLSKILGYEKVINKSLELIDDIWTSENESEENKRLLIESKTKAKVELLSSYAPFKLAQRWIAFGFTSIFLLIMLNGVIGSMYGIIDLDKVNKAKEFANSMWLGEIMVLIVTFYFGGGLAESIKKKNNI